jgi:hypothetical protein
MIADPIFGRVMFSIRFKLVIAAVLKIIVAVDLVQEQDQTLNGVLNSAGASRAGIR